MSSRLLAPAAAVALLFSLTSGPSAEPFEFAVLGDMPYGPDQVGSLSYIGGTLRERKVPFIVHYGDIKAGYESCHESLLAARKEVIYGMMQGKVFFVPGDNDWTDCDRPEAGRYDELERLETLRKTFFRDDRIPRGGNLMVVRDDDDFPEHARWQHKGTHFVALHIVGTSNGRDELDGTDEAKALDLVERREKATHRFMNLAFAEAIDANAEALVVVIHADPTDVAKHRVRGLSCSANPAHHCDSYADFIKLLKAQSGRFGRPVLLVHGDTNSFCLQEAKDKSGEGDFWRLNGPGDFTTADAAIVIVDPMSAPPFKVYGLLSGDRAADCSDRLRSAEK